MTGTDQVYKMSLKSFLKKASMSLGIFLLACNTGCNSLNNRQDTPHLKREVSTGMENEEYKKPKAWQYPVNILGGYLLGSFTHESSHAVAALAVGMEIEDYHPNPFISGKYVEHQLTYVKVTNESYHNASSKERVVYAIAGPISDITIMEIINYNLRNGNISETHQPFWATTNLVYRALLLNNAIQGADGRYGNDFVGIEKNTEVSTETILGIISLYTALSSRRIAKEFKVAIGRDIYPVKEQKSRIDLLPSQDGLDISCTLNF